MDFLEKTRDGICLSDDDAKCAQASERDREGALRPDSKAQLREALSKAIPNIACRRRGSNKIITGKSLQACDVWLLQQRQDLGRARILQLAVDIQWLMLRDEGYDENMLQRAEDELRHKLLHTSNDTLVEVLAEFFPEPYQEILRKRITWTRYLKQRIFLQEMD